MMILTSQVRVEVATNPYTARGGPKTKQAGEMRHYANFILEFQDRYNSDIMFETLCRQVRGQRQSYRSLL